MKPSSLLCILLVLLVIASQNVEGAVRDYYLGAKEVSWNYAPLGLNKVFNRAFNDEEALWTVPGPAVPKVGNIYKKAIYVEFTDDSFQTEKPRSSEWQHLGILGPPIRGVVGDTIRVHFKNFASQSFSLHPHGVHYLKDSEGAPYNDGTSGTDKADDAVAPGATHTFIWEVPATAGPGPSDPSSVVWLYHSHTDEMSNVNAGLVGPIIITAAGQSKSGSDPSPSGIDREFVIFANLFDENDSVYIDDNIALYTTVPVDGGSTGPPPYHPAHMGSEAGDESYAERSVATRTDPTTFLPVFRTSNLKATINGLLYGNGADGFVMDEGDRVRWYVISLGTYHTQFIDPANGLGSGDGFHTIRFHGHTFASGSPFDGSRQREQVVAAMPASMHTVDMTMVNPGTWLLQCSVSFHTLSGMTTLYTVNPNSAASTPLSLSGATRTYYIAATEVEWNYAPSGSDNVNTGLAFSDPDTDPAINREMVQTDLLVGRVYKKAVFRRYTDATFATEWSSGTDDYDHLGILGPVIYAAVGDTVNVVFKNLASIPYSLNAFGAHLTKANEGIAYNDGTSGSDRADEGIQPGQSYTYQWLFPAWSGPGPDDGSSVVWIYQSANSLVNDVHAGLMGPIVVTRANSVRSSSDLRPNDVDRELFVLAMTINENLSPYLEDNINAYTSAGLATVLSNPFFAAANWKFSLNGQAYGNLPHMTATTSQRVRIYFLSLGTIDGGIHAIHFHGQNYIGASNLRKGVIEMLPGLSRTADIVPQFPGRFKVECHSIAHGVRGMTAFFDVSGTAVAQQTSGGTTRTYYIAATEVVWDYAPLAINNITKKPFGTSTDPREAWLVSSPIHLGRKCWKAVYRQFTDATFTVLAPIDDAWQHLNLLGPPIRAVVGDTINVVFFNNASHPFSIHPQALLYNKANEGDNYIDGEIGPDDLVQPGSTFTYQWYVPASAGPGSADPSSVAWMYYSRASETLSDVDSGLIGPIIISRPGTTKSASDLSPAGVDREFVLLFAILREASSLYWAYNLQYYGKTAANQEVGSDQRSSINGRMYGNSGPFLMSEGDNVRWYIITTGSFDGVHTPHWHGITVVDTGHRTDVTEILPTSTRTVDSVADNPGTWMAHCHVSSHLNTGMVILFSIDGDSNGGGGSSPAAAVLVSPFLLLLSFFFFYFV